MNLRGVLDLNPKPHQPLNPKPMFRDFRARIRRVQFVAVCRRGSHDGFGCTIPTVDDINPALPQGP